MFSKKISQKTFKMAEISVLQWQTSPNFKKIRKRKYFFFRKRVFSKIISNVSNRVVSKYTLIIWSQISSDGKKGFGVSPLNGLQISSKKYETLSNEWEFERPKFGPPSGVKNAN